MNLKTVSMKYSKPINASSVQPFYSSKAIETLNTFTAHNTFAINILTLWYKENKVTNT